MSRLDMNLVRRARRAPRNTELGDNDRIAMNALWRSGVRVPVLAKIFRCSRNTVYYNCLTGDAVSYPSNRALEINAYIDQIGLESAFKHYVTTAMIQEVNRANAEIAAAHDDRAAQRANP